MLVERSGRVTVANSYRRYYNPQYCSEAAKLFGVPLSHVDVANMAWYQPSGCYLSRTKFRSSLCVVRLQSLRHRSLCVLLGSVHDGRAAGKLGAPRRDGTPSVVSARYGIIYNIVPAWVGGYCPSAP